MTGQALFDYLARDISDRRGLKREWGAIDADVMEEIRAAWVAVFDAALKEERERCAKECEQLDELLAGSYAPGSHIADRIRGLR